MNILITEPEDYSQFALDLYSSAGNVVLLPELNISLSEAIPGADAIVVKLKYHLTEELLKNASQLKYIISPTTGLDHIDEKAAEKQGIQIISLRGETSFLNSIPSTAEFTWALLLALMKRIPPALQHVVEGGWDRNLFKGNNLKGKKIGILGLGRVGRQVASYAQAFGMEVMAFDPYLGSWLPGVQKAVSAEKLAEWCDIFSIHIPVVGNDNFVSAELLQLLNPGSIIINTSRGSVWDEQCVATMLSGKRLAGAGTDVLKGEMTESIRSQSPLLSLAGKLDNLIITPHIAGATIESMEATENFVAEKFMQLFAE